MRVRSIVAVVAAPALVVLSQGCATSSSDQVANSVYATHRIVKNLETDLGPRVTQLSETAADLTARVEASEQSTRALQTMMEESQAKLDSLQKTLDRLSQIVYQEFGRYGAGTRSFEAEAPTIEPPLAGSPTGPLPAPTDNSLAPPPAAATVTPGPTATGNALTDYNQAQQSFVKEDYETALQQYDGYLRQYPNTDNVPNAQFWKAESLRKLRRYEEAIQNYETLRQSFPTSSKVPIAMNYQAECHIQLGQTQRAADLLTQLVENYPMAPASDQAKATLKSLQGN